MAKAPTLKTDHATEWALPKTNADGYEVDNHGLPTSRVARAIQLAKDGAKSDPADPPLVTPEEIEAQNPKGVAADQEAAAEYRVKRNWGDDAKVDELAQTLGAVPPGDPSAPPPADGKDA